MVRSRPSSLIVDRMYVTRLPKILADSIGLQSAVTATAVGAAALRRIVASRCSRDTGGTCSVLPCATSRNAVCVNNKCMCASNQCASSRGICGASSHWCSRDTGGTCSSLVNLCSFSNAVCVNNKCMCASNQCASSTGFCFTYKNCSFTATTNCAAVYPNADQCRVLCQLYKDTAGDDWIDTDGPI